MHGLGCDCGGPISLAARRTTTARVEMFALCCFAINFIQTFSLTAPLVKKFFKNRIAFVLIREKKVDLWVNTTQYCNEKDNYPYNCDRLAHNYELLDAAALLVHFFAVIISLIPAIQDLDQASDKMMFVSAQSTFTLLFSSTSQKVSSAPRTGSRDSSVGFTESLQKVHMPGVPPQPLDHRLHVGRRRPHHHPLHWPKDVGARGNSMARVLEQRDRELGWKKYHLLYGALLALTLFGTMPQMRIYRHFCTGDSTSCRGFSNARDSI